MAIISHITGCQTISTLRWFCVRARAQLDYWWNYRLLFFRHQYVRYPTVRRLAGLGISLALLSGLIVRVPPELRAMPLSGQVTFGAVITALVVVFAILLFVCSLYLLTTDSRGE